MEDVGVKSLLPDQPFLWTAVPRVKQFLLFFRGQIFFISRLPYTRTNEYLWALFLPLSRAHMLFACLGNNGFIFFPVYLKTRNTILQVVRHRYINTVVYARNHAMFITTYLSIYNITSFWHPLLVVVRVNNVCKYIHDRY